MSGHRSNTCKSHFRRGVYLPLPRRLAHMLVGIESGAYPILMLILYGQNRFYSQGVHLGVHLGRDSGSERQFMFSVPQKTAGLSN